MIDDLNYDDLDPGIRETVRKMRLANFNTCDSGDGASKQGDDNWINEPHVFCRCDPKSLIEEADRMQRDIVGSRSNVIVEASYNPADGIGIIAVFGLLDEMLESNS